MAPRTGFSFSGLHDAGGTNPMSGTSIGDLHGRLTFDWEVATDTYVLTGSTVWLDSADYSFEIVGGELEGSGGGFLSFKMKGKGHFVQDGDILFTGGGSVCCGGGGPNYLDASELRLWGAVDTQNYGTGDLGTPKRFGIDLAANAVPEPTGAVVFAVGMLIVQRGLRRRMYS